MTRNAASHPGAGGRTRPAAFTLVELLVVIGIIAVLMGILLPSMAGTRRQSRALQCASNIRQLCGALFNYAADNKQRFPSNLANPTPGTLWYLPSSAGSYISKDGPVIGSVFTCPEDLEGAKRSYSMNVWASSALEPTVALLNPKRGQLWGPATKGSSQLILVTESWSSLANPDGRDAAGLIGYRGLTAGHRFGGGTGIAPPIDAGIFGKANSELAFDRHRSARLSRLGTEPVGALNIGYADGHVAMKTNRDLVDAETGKSTFDSIWSTWDADNP